MHVSFLNPPLTEYRKLIRNFDCATESKANYLYQPYDFLVMSSCVPLGWSLSLIDGIAQKSSIDNVLEELSVKTPDVLVISMANTSWRDDLDTLKRIRTRFPTMKLYVFGDLFIEEFYRVEVEAYVEGILEDPIYVDFHKLARGEKPTLRGMFKTNKSQIKKPEKVNIGMPRHEAFNHPSYRWPFSRHKKYTSIFTAWGCPYSCSYCVMSSFPNLWRGHDDIIQEMKYVKKLGYKEVYIADRSFGVFYENTIKLLSKMIDDKLNFSWSAYFHPNQYHKEMLELMKKSGCHTLIVGIESADLHGLKKYGRHVKQEKLENLLKHCKTLGIDVCADFIIGLPNETRADIRKTIKLAKTLDIQYASFNIAAPLPGTELRKMAMSDKKMSESEFNKYDSFGRSRVLDNGVLSGEEIKTLRNQAIFEFYLRPGYLLSRLLKVKSIEHLSIQFNEAIGLLSSKKRS